LDRIYKIFKRTGYLVNPANLEILSLLDRIAGFSR